MAIKVIHMNNDIELLGYCVAVCAGTFSLAAQHPNGSPARKRCIIDNKTRHDNDADDAWVLSGEVYQFLDP